VLGVPSGFRSRSTAPITLKEFDASGVVRRTIALPAEASWAIPVGDSVFLPVAGGIYRLDTDTGTARLVAHGEISYFNNDGSTVPSIDVFTCDDTLKCLIKTFDGDGKVIATRATERSDSGPTTTPRGEIPSPDGKYRVMFSYEDSSIEVLDVAGKSLWKSPGRSSAGLSLANGPTSLRWSNDSKWLFIQTGTGMKAWTKNRPDLVDVGIGRVGAFDVVAK